MKIYKEFECDCFEHGRQQYNKWRFEFQWKEQNFYCGPGKNLYEIYVENETGKEWVGIINMALTRVRLFIFINTVFVYVRWGETEVNLLPLEPFLVFGFISFSHGAHTMYNMQSNRY